MSGQIVDEFGTEETPAYNIVSQDMLTTLTVASVLFVTTVGTMMALADTIVADTVLWMYDTLAILGVLVMSFLLGYGGNKGMAGLVNDDMETAFKGILITVLSFGAFGAAVLTRFDTTSYLSDIVLATVATLAVTSFVTSYVVWTDRTFEGWQKRAGILFIFGLIAVTIGSLGIKSMIMLGFGFFLLGFVVDFVYQVWSMLSGNRDPVSNGFGIYFSFTGIFVHLLQLVGDE